MSGYIRRNAFPLVQDALGDTRVVVVQGARQVGKSTLVKQVVDRNDGRLVTLDDELTRASAQADPGAFLRQAPGQLLAIDEVQRAPELVLALKLAVDRDPRPGRFLLTGSANLLRLPTVEDSLAGRAEGIELHGFSQGEIAGYRESFVDRLLDGELFLGHESDLGRHEYLERAIAGSYPEALERTSGRRRSRWLDNYVARIVERDAPDVSTMHALDQLPTTLRAIAARNGEELNLTSLSNTTDTPTSTLRRLVALLETLYLVQRVPAWSTNLSKRVIARPKAMLLDTGLAARLVNVSAPGAAPSANGEVAGHLLEGFVAGELRRQLSWAEETATLSHYRERTGAEIDFVLETPDGRVAAIEVKARTTTNRRDARWIERLRDALGGRFVGGLVLHTGTTSAPFGERVAAAPLDILWRA